MAGRRLALANVRYDTDALDLMVVTAPTLSIRADDAEFVAPTSPDGSSAADASASPEESPADADESS